MPEPIVLKVNGTERAVAAAPATPLVYILRNDLQLKGTRFGCGEFFLPELVQGALAMQEGVAVLQPAFESSDEGRQTIGKAVAATVEG